MNRRRSSAGVTLMELLIAVTLMSLLAVGIMISFRVGLSAMNKSDAKLMANRRVASVTKIIGHELSGVMPVTADCQAAVDAPPARIAFFQGEPDSMRLASSYSLQQASRGLPMILEFHVIPGEENRGVRLIVNEHTYTGPRSAGQFCLGVFPDSITGAPRPRFAPIQVGATSFVLADKLAYCRLSYQDYPPPPEPQKWLAVWIKPLLPNAIRIEMAPLDPDVSRLSPVTLTIPIRVTRHALEDYAN